MDSIKTRQSRRQLRAILASVGTAAALQSVALALPNGGNPVTPGTTIDSPNASTLNVTTTQQASIIDWGSFNVANGERVNFLQPNSGARVLNRVRPVEASFINGAISSNGQVFVVNPAGVIFGYNSVVNTGGIVAAAGTIKNADFLSGTYAFSNMTAGVENYGRLQAPVVALVGRYVKQHGRIINKIPENTLLPSFTTAPAEVAIMAAGDSVIIGDAFGSVFVSIDSNNLDLSGSVGGGVGTSPLGASDSFGIAAWHTPRGRTEANTVHIASAGRARIEGNVLARSSATINARDSVSFTSEIRPALVTGQEILVTSERGNILGDGVFEGGRMTGIARSGAIKLTGGADPASLQPGTGHRVGVVAIEAGNEALFINQGNVDVQRMRVLDPAGLATIATTEGGINVSGSIEANEVVVDSASRLVIPGVIDGAAGEPAELVTLQSRLPLAGNAEGVVIFSDGSIRAEQLQVLSELGVLLLGANAVDTLGAEALFLEMNNTRGLTVGTAGTTSGVQTTGRTVLTVQNGVLGTASGELIEAGNIVATSNNGSVDIDVLTNGTVEGKANNGVFTVDTDGSLILGPIEATFDVAINANGNVSVLGAKVRSVAGQIGIQSQGGSVVATDSSSLDAATFVDIDAANSIELGSAQVTAQGASFNAGQTITSTGLDVDQVDATSTGTDANGNITLTNAKDLVVTTVTTTGAEVRISADGTLTVAGELSSADLVAASASGDIQLDGTTTAEIADLTAGGSVAGEGVVEANRLRVRAAGGGIALTGANEVGNFAAEATGAVIMNNEGTLTITSIEGADGTTTAGISTTGGPITVVVNGGSINVGDQVSTNGRAELIARNGAIQGGGRINANEALLLANGNITLLNGDNSFQSVAARSDSGSVRVATNGAVSVDRLTLTNQAQALSGANGDAAIVDGLFAGDQIELLANGDITVNTDRIIALNGGDNSGAQDAIVLDTGLSGDQADRRIIFNGPGGMVELATQIDSNGSIIGNGGGIRLNGHVDAGGREVSVYVGANGQATFGGDIGSQDARLASLFIGDRAQGEQSFRNGNTRVDGDIFTDGRILVQGDLAIGRPIDGRDGVVIDSGTGIMEFFGDITPVTDGDLSVTFAAEVGDQFDGLPGDAFSVHVPMRFYGDIGSQTRVFERVALGGDAATSQFATMLFLDSNLRLAENGQFFDTNGQQIDALDSIHTDESFAIWTDAGVEMGDGQRLLVLGDLSLQTPNGSPATHRLSDISVIGVEGEGGNLVIDGDVDVLVRSSRQVYDRVAVLDSNQVGTLPSDRGTDLIASNSIAISGSVRAADGFMGDGALATESGGSVSVSGSNAFDVLQLGGGATAAEALVVGAVQADGTITPIGPVVAFDLTAVGAPASSPISPGEFGDGLSEALAAGLPDDEAASSSTDVSLSAADLAVLNRELGIVVQSPATPSPIVVIAGQPIDNAPTRVSAASTATLAPTDLPAVQRERITATSLGRVLQSYFQVLGASEPQDFGRYPGAASRSQVIANLNTALATDRNSGESLGAYRQRLLAEASDSAAANFLRGMQRLMVDVRNLGLTEQQIDVAQARMAETLADALQGQFSQADIRALLGFDADAAAPDRVVIRSNQTAPASNPAGGIAGE